MWMIIFQISENGVRKIQLQTVIQRIKHIEFVFEMPIDSTARYVGTIGDVVQGGIGYAAFEKHINGRIHDAVTSFKSFLFSTSDHVQPSTNGSSAIDKMNKSALLYIHARMYNSCHQQSWPRPTIRTHLHKLAS